LTKIASNDREGERRMESGVNGAVVVQDRNRRLSHSRDGGEVADYEESTAGKQFDVGGRVGGKGNRRKGRIDSPVRPQTKQLDEERRGRIGTPKDYYTSIGIRRQGEPKIVLRRRQRRIDRTIGIEARERCDHAVD
jgi:hypothetical protein